MSKLIRNNNNQTLDIYRELKINHYKFPFKL